MCGSSVVKSPHFGGLTACVQIKRFRHAVRENGRTERRLDCGKFFRIIDGGICLDRRIVAARDRYTNLCAKGLQTFNIRRQCAVCRRSYGHIVGNSLTRRPCARRINERNSPIDRFIRRFLRQHGSSQSISRFRLRRNTVCRIVFGSNLRGHNFYPATDAFTDNRAATVGQGCRLFGNLFVFVDIADYPEAPGTDYDAENQGQQI